MPNAKPLFSPDKTSAPIHAPFSFLFDISKDKTFESRSGDYVIDRRLTFDDHPRCSRDLEHLDFMDIRRLKCSRAERPIGMNYRPEGTSRAVPETLQGGPPKTIQSVGHFRPGLLCPRFHGGPRALCCPRARSTGIGRTDRRGQTTRLTSRRRCGIFHPFNTREKTQNEQPGHAPST